MRVFVIATVSTKTPQNSYTQCTAAAWFDIFKSYRRIPEHLFTRRALHHHAACWLVNMHITWHFCPPVLWWKMLWNPSIASV